MTDIIDFFSTLKEKELLKKENAELKQQLKAMGEGYVNLVFELHEAQEKLSKLEVLA